jgi:hypothetical protein
MLRYFEPKFEEYDLVHMDNRNFVINMTISGEKTAAFSASTLNLPPQHYDYTANIIQHSRTQFAVSRTEAENYIHRRYELDPKQPATQSQPSKAAKKPAPKPKTQPKAVQRPQAAAPQPAAPAQPQSEAAAPPAQSSDPSTMGRTAVGSLVEMIKPKRRRRRRNKKHAEEPHSTQVAREPDSLHIPTPPPEQAPAAKAKSPPPAQARPKSKSAHKPKPDHKPRSESPRPKSLAETTETTEHTIFKR